MTTPSRELTPEQIPAALAEAQGWISTPDNASEKWWNKDGTPIVLFSSYNPLTNAEQRCKLTEDPEIHAGMMDILDGWLTEEDEDEWTPWYEQDVYKQDIRLWQLRACVEFLRRRGK